METRQTWVRKSDWVDFVDLPKTLDYTAKIFPKILEAQDIPLREALGWDFYQAMAAVLNNNGLVSGATVDGEAVTITQTAYDNLVPYLRPYLIHYAYAFYLESSGIEETRYGTVAKTNPHSKEITDSRRDKQVHFHKGRATHYLKRVRLFLEKYKSDYADFFQIEIKNRQGTPRISSIWDQNEELENYKKQYGWPI